MKFDCEFLFAALAKKHNAVIRKIREIPPWEWGGEFPELAGSELFAFARFRSQVSQVNQVKRPSLVGTVVVGCSVFGPGIGASVY